MKTPPPKQRKIDPHDIYAKAYEDAAKRFRMREDEIIGVVIRKIEDKLKFYDYYCEDPDCCYKDVVDGVRELLESL